MFKLEKVVVLKTPLSGPGITHVAATLPGVVSAYRANQLQQYLERRLQSGRVVGVYDGKDQILYLFTFIIGHFSTDATTKVAGHLGLAALRHASKEVL